MYVKSKKHKKTMERLQGQKCAIDQHHKKTSHDIAWKKGTIFSFVILAKKQVLEAFYIL